MQTRDHRLSFSLDLIAVDTCVGHITLHHCVVFCIPEGTGHQQVVSLICSENRVAERRLLGKFDANNSASTNRSNDSSTKTQFTYSIKQTTELDLETTCSVDYLLTNK